MKCLWIDLFIFCFFLLVQLVNLNWAISLECAMKTTLCYHQEIALTLMKQTVVFLELLLL